MYTMLVLLCLTWLFATTNALVTTAHGRDHSTRKSPQVTVRNGTLQGLHLPAFDEDVFLGIPFAASPVGDLRLRHPQPFGQNWNGVRAATQRSASCPGYAGFMKALPVVGEDCLTVDVVRPAGTQSRDKLPVMVWIYGGGFTAGGSADARYNSSYLVNASVAINRPVIAVSLNYRVAGFGFLASKEVVEAGEANIGLFDQRLALRWVQENIHAFGGDPTKVTIFGESAGAFSVGYHLTGFDGKNDGLFRAAILQSGSALGPGINTPAQLPDTYQPIYDNVTTTVGCAKAKDSLACLRTVPYETLFNAFAPFVLTPILDGNFLRRLPSESFAKGLVAKVAILAGTNTDEGTASFFGPRNTLQNDDDIHNLIGGLGNRLSNSTVLEAMQLYPDDPAQGCPFNTGAERFADQGYMYKRGAAIVGDSVIHAGRRFTAHYFASRPRQVRQPVYSYRFDQPPWDGTEELVATVAPVYSTHYAEICFVFNLGPSASRNNSNWIGPYKEFHELSDFIARSWVSFAHDLDPNSHGCGRSYPKWPEYSKSESNMVFRARGSWVERDVWRTPQLKFWSKIWAQLKT